ncbi:hypothetical protein BDF22DRAFT_669435, partial [Syncephalis plumigaleata]
MEESDAILEKLNGYEYIIRAQSDPATLRKRYMAVFLQAFLITLILVFFTRNLWRAIQVFIKYPRRLASCCCMVLTVTSVLSFIGCVFFGSWFGPSCEVSAWVIMMGMVVFTIATNIIMLERAYLAIGRRRWLLIAGAFAIILPGPFYIYMVYLTTTMTISDLYGCHTQFDYYLPYVRLLLDLPANTIFSSIFSVVVYRRYKLQREACWKELARDGAATMLLIIMSNIICFVLNISKLLGEFGDTFYIIDWLIASTLLVENNRRMFFGAHTRKSEKPSTENSEPSLIITQT